jgi:hypothetical protein
MTVKKQTVSEWYIYTFNIRNRLKIQKEENIQPVRLDMILNKLDI